MYNPLFQGGTSDISAGIASRGQVERVSLFGSGAGHCVCVYVYCYSRVICVANSNFNKPKLELVVIAAESQKRADGDAFFIIPKNFRRSLIRERKILISP